MVHTASVAGALRILQVLLILLFNPCAAATQDSDCCCVSAQHIFGSVLDIILQQAQKRELDVIMQWVDKDGNTAMADTGVIQTVFEASSTFHGVTASFHFGDDVPPPRITSNQQRLVLVRLLASNNVSTAFKSILDILLPTEYELNNDETNFIFAIMHVYPTKTKALQETESIIKFMGQRATLADAVYMLSFYCGDSSGRQGSGPDMLPLIHEAYHIRDTLTVREIDPDGISIGLRSRRLNFEGAVVIGVGVPDHNIDFIDTKFKDGTEEFEQGHEVETYRYFRDLLNFTEKSVKDDGYISPGPNGTVKGFATRLVGGDADVGISSTEFVPYRMQGPNAIRILIPVIRVRLDAYFKQPRTAMVRNVYIQPFTLGVWSTTLGLWIFVGIAMEIMAIQLAKEPQQDTIALAAAGNGFLGTGARILQQGWYAIPPSLIGKFLAILTSLAALVLWVAYSGALVSILSVNIEPVRVFQDLAVYNFELVNDAEVPAAGAILQAMGQHHEIPPSQYKGSVPFRGEFDKLLQSRLAIVTQRENFYPFASYYNSIDFICTQISTVLVPRARIPMSPCVRKGSPLRGSLNYAVTRMIETGGLPPRFRRLPLTLGEEVCPKKDEVRHESLGLDDLVTAFGALMLGGTISVGVCLLERFHIVFLLRRRRKVEHSIEEE